MLDLLCPPRFFPALLFALSLTHLIPPPLNAQEPSVIDELTVEEDRIQRIDPDSNEVLWEITHLSLRGADVGRSFIAKGELAAPVVWGNRVFYGIYNWLVELDPEQGRIKSRRWFPSPISHIAPDEDGLKLQLEIPGDDTSKTVTFVHRPGQPTTDEIWHIIGLISLYQDAAFIIPEPYVPDDTPTSEERQEQLLWLKTQASRDQTNPFYLYFQGKLLIDEGDPERAEELFDQIFASAHLHWTSLIQLSALFDSINARDRADQAFEMALKLLPHTAQTSIFQGSTLLASVLLLNFTEQAVSDAIYANQLDRVDLLHGRTAELFPNLAHSKEAWLALSRWFTHHDRPDLAEKWRTKAESFEPSPQGHLIHKQIRQLQFGPFLFIALILASALSSLIVGARRANRLSPSGWLPKPTLPELTTLVLTLFIAAPLTLAMWVNSSEIIDHLTLAPDDIEFGGWTSPNSTRWIEQLHPSRANAQLLSQIQDLSQATYAGELSTFSGPTPDQVLFAHALKKDHNTRLKETLVQVYFGDQISLPRRAGFFAILTIATVFLFFIGHLLGARTPKIATALRYIIPGGARSASLATPLICTTALFAAASIALNASIPFQDTLANSASQRFGHPGIFEQFHQPYAPSWPYLLLAIAIAAHALTLWLDRVSNTEGRGQLRDDPCRLARQGKRIDS